MRTLDWMSYPPWLAAISLAFLALERLAPRRPDPGILRPDLWVDGVYVVFNGHVLGLALAGLTGYVTGPVEHAASAHGLARWLHAGLASGWPPWAQFIVAFTVIDCFKWCIHNLLHRVPWLWAFHRVHHSIVTMDWPGSMRFHFVEALFYDALLYVPLAVLGLGPGVLFAMAVVGTALGHWNHANTRVSIGPLAYVLNSPAMHVWHHAHPEAGPADRNFGVNLALWDWCFGTAWLPDRPPARLGFQGIEGYPRDPLRQAIAPLRAWPVTRRPPTR